MKAFIFSCYLVEYKPNGRLFHISNIKRGDKAWRIYKSQYEDKLKT